MYGTCLVIFMTQQKFFLLHFHYNLGNLSSFKNFDVVMCLSEWLSTEYIIYILCNA